MVHDALAAHYSQSLYRKLFLVKTTAYENCAPLQEYKVHFYDPAPSWAILSDSALKHPPVRATLFLAWFVYDPRILGMQQVFALTDGSAKASKFPEMVTASIIESTELTKVDKEHAHPRAPVQDRKPSPLAADKWPRQYRI